MTNGWTPERERRAIVAHVARCAFCRALLAHGRRRRDRTLLEAAYEHASLELEWPGFRASSLAAGLELRRRAGGR